MKIKRKLTHKDFIQMEQLEKKFYEEEYITPAQESYEWYLKRPCSIIALEYNDTIIGFMNLFPIGENIFQEIKAGTYNDKYLTYEDIIDIDRQHTSHLNLFLSCVVIEEEFRHLGALKLLLSSYVEYYNGMSINHVIGDAVTNDGERFFEKLGLQQQCISNHESTIYSGTYATFVEAVNKIIAP